VCEVLITSHFQAPTGFTGSRPLQIFTWLAISSHVLLVFSAVLGVIGGELQVICDVGDRLGAAVGRGVLGRVGRRSGVIEVWVGGGGGGGCGLRPRV
jgi:hypothetical protein